MGFRFVNTSSNISMYCFGLPQLISSSIIISDFVLFFTPVFSQRVIPENDSDEESETLLNLDTIEDGAFIIFFGNFIYI